MAKQDSNPKQDAQAQSKKSIGFLESEEAVEKLLKLNVVFYREETEEKL